MERVLPWGMPWVMVCVFDCACCVCVDCCLLRKYDAKNATVGSVKLKLWRSLWRSLLWDTVSYALERSM